MEGVLHQVLSGIATGGIYASVALALVMIYQATHHVNFAQGEMATFSTYIALTLINAGLPYWVAFVDHRRRLVRHRRADRTHPDAADDGCAGAGLGRRVHRPAADHQQPAPAGCSTTRSRPSRRRSPAGRCCSAATSPATNSARPRVTLVVLIAVYLFFRHTKLGLAMRAAAFNPVSARLVGIRVGWMLALGWGLAAAIGAIAGMMVAPIVYPRSQHDGGHPALCLRRRAAGRHRQSAGRGARRLRRRLIENLAGAYLVGTELKLTVALIIIVAVLVVKPSGLFGRTVLSTGVTGWRAATTAAPDGRPPVSCCGSLALRADASVQQLPPVPAHHGGGLCHRHPRPRHPDRLQRPDLAGPRRVLCDRRLRHRHPDVPVQRALLGDAAGLGDRLRRRSAS